MNIMQVLFNHIVFQNKILKKIIKINIERLVKF